MAEPRVYVDFQNADPEGRVRLNCVGTAKDLAQQHVVLRPNMVLELYSDDADPNGCPDDLQVTGVVEYSETERCWVARVDWNAMHHASQSPQKQRR